MKNENYISLTKEPIAAFQKKGITVYMPILTEEYLKVLEKNFKQELLDRSEEEWVEIGASFFTIEKGKSKDKKLKSNLMKSPFKIKQNRGKPKYRNPKDKFFLKEDADDECHEGKFWNYSINLIYLQEKKELDTKTIFSRIANNITRRITIVEKEQFKIILDESIQDRIDNNIIQELRRCFEDAIDKLRRHFKLFSIFLEEIEELQIEISDIYNNGSANPNIGITLDIDFLENYGDNLKAIKALVYHELFHFVEYAYGFRVHTAFSCELNNSCIEHFWFSEGLSKWAEVYYTGSTITPSTVSIFFNRYNLDDFFFNKSSKTLPFWLFFEPPFDSSTDGSSPEVIGNLLTNFSYNPFPKQILAGSLQHHSTITPLESFFASFIYRICHDNWRILSAGGTPYDIESNGANIPIDDMRYLDVCWKNLNRSMSNLAIKALGVDLYEVDDSFTGTIEIKNRSNSDGTLYVFLVDSLNENFDSSIVRQINKSQSVLLESPTPNLNKIVVIGGAEIQRRGRYSIILDEGVT